MPFWAQDSGDTKALATPKHYQKLSEKANNKTIREAFKKCKKVNIC